nr:C-terminal helicase domain-containing protein [Streptomyces sp. gb14]
MGITVKAGGTGLTLSPASHVILFDRSWNPAREGQAVDRAHRLGQTSTVTVHQRTTERAIMYSATTPRTCSCI